MNVGKARRERGMGSGLKAAWTKYVYPDLCLLQLTAPLMLVARTYCGSEMSGLPAA